MFQFTGDVFNLIRISRYQLWRIQKQCDGRTLCIHISRRVSFGYAAHDSLVLLVQKIVEHITRAGSFEGPVHKQRGIGVGGGLGRCPSSHNLVALFVCGYIVVSVKVGDSQAVDVVLVILLRDLDVYVSLLCGHFLRRRVFPFLYLAVQVFLAHENRT